jgi:alpha-1,3-mannosyltransferase
MLSYLTGKRQSRSLLQAFIVLSLILLYFFFAHDGYWYGGDGEEDPNREAEVKEETRPDLGGSTTGVGIEIEGIHSPTPPTGTTTGVVVIDHATTTPTGIDQEKNSTTEAEPTGQHTAVTATPTPTPSAAVVKVKAKLPAQTPNPEYLRGEKMNGSTSKHIKAILDPFDTSFDRLSCPTGLSFYDRYAYLRSSSSSSTASSSSSPTTIASSPAIAKPKYFFALDLYQIVDLLPRLMNSILEAIKFLGAENCVLSIVEGRSEDGTYEVLYNLAQELEKLGAKYILQTSDLNPHDGARDRIDALSELRNLALSDLISHPSHYAADTTVIFSNDVALCVEDILELVHQKALQKADMVCGMDWNIWDPLAFYDSWVGRGINGDLFIKIIKEGDQMVDNDAGIFWNHPLSRQRHDAWKPLQVFACWNGITAFTAKPIMEHKIKFRFVPNNAEARECYQSEPNLFAKDLWFHGYGKIAVVPTVNLAYSDGAAKALRQQKGWVQQHVVPDEEAMIEWTSTPPEKVVCVPWLRGDQEWYAWNQGLPGAVEETKEKE